MIRTLLLLTVAGTALVGCRHAAPTGVELRPFQPAVPQAMTLRTPERVRAYHLGRTIDPRRPDLMREAHTIYRLERPAFWDLRPASRGRPDPKRQPPEAVTKPDFSLVPNP